jgi:hypothetical protein
MIFGWKTNPAWVAINQKREDERREIYFKRKMAQAEIDAMLRRQEFESCIRIGQQFVVKRKDGIYER